MKLSIIYHIYKNTSHLESSLKNIFDQKQQDFEFILVNDSATPSVLKILKKFNFTKLKHFTYYNFSQNMGHSFSFNRAVKQARGEYVYYCGSNIILKKDFVSTIYSIIKKQQDVDVISFTNRENGSNQVVFSKLDSSLERLVPISIKYAITRKKILVDNNIFLNDEHYFPLIFICRLLMIFKK
jgi:glycosyltransferase involved in cell wall biosynthesis